MRAAREMVKSGVHRLFETGQRFGVDILPRHFYSAMPDIRELKQNQNWRKPCSMKGVSGAEIEPQLDLLRQCCCSVRPLLDGRIHKAACADNAVPGYGPVESDFLFAFILAKQPQRIVQIGCGVSTAVILMAARHAGYSPDLVCIDPYPTQYLRSLHERGEISLIEQKAQDVALDTFDADFLFVDSTHTVKAGSQVNRIILEVLPRFQGEYVHFHDIYFPYDYPSTVLNSLVFNCESTLLHAFLVHNNRYSIAVSLSMLHHECPEELSRMIPHYHAAPMEYGVHLDRESGHFPSATYLRLA